MFKDGVHMMTLMCHLLFVVLTNHMFVSPCFLSILPMIKRKKNTLLSLRVQSTLKVYVEGWETSKISRPAYIGGFFSKL